jgi:hypothetical protein
MANFKSDDEAEVIVLARSHAPATATGPTSGDALTSALHVVDAWRDQHAGELRTKEMIDAELEEERGSLGEP